MYIHSVTGQEKFITIPAQLYVQYIVNLINKSSASTSGSLVKTFSKSKEVDESTCIFYVLFKFKHWNHYLTSDEILFSLMFGKVLYNGFLNIKCPMSHKNSR